MISDYEEVVIRFKAYRISYPLTQKELSDKSGVSLRSITRFESGEDISLANYNGIHNLTGFLPDTCHFHII
jgi:transcriptional regulator with XRE-family HTH domain